MQLYYRPYQAADFSYCNDLMEENMGSYFAAFGINWDPDRYLKELAKGDAWIIWLNQEKVGFVHTSKKKGLPYIDSIQIASLYRKKGIGSRVLSWLELACKQAGHQEMRLSVFKSSPALKLYHRIGYEIKEDRGSKYLMHKFLR
ncbi:MAG: GNAT family N-acetyltransferase [Bacteroidota bacterium]